MSGFGAYGYMNSGFQPQEKNKFNFSSLVPGIPTALDFIGNVFGNRSRRREAERQRKFDLDMWNRQNAYNTPAMQMQRLREAGLNPALMYGQGTTGNASNQPKATQPQIVNPLSSSGVASGVQLSLMNTQKNLLKSSAFKNYADAAQSKATKNRIDAMLPNEVRDLQMASKVKAQQIVESKERIKDIKATISERHANISLKDMQSLLAKQGLEESKWRIHKIKEEARAIYEDILIRWSLADSNWRKADASMLQAKQAELANYLKVFMQKAELDFDKEKQWRSFWMELGVKYLGLPADLLSNVENFIK